MGDGAATQTRSRGRTFFRRSASTLGLWTAVVAVFASGRAWACLGLIGALAVVATREYFTILRRAGVACVPVWGVLLGVVYCVGMDAWLLQGVARGVVPVVPGWWDALGLFAAVGGTFVLQLRRPVNGLEPVSAVAVHALGFVYVAYLFQFTARLLFAVPGEGELPGGWLLLWVLAVTKFTDMGAYLTGTVCGRHKMIPHISPAKTWEGFAGALGFALLAGCGLAALWPAHYAVLGGPGWVAALSLVIALLAVAGDLAESVLKRGTGAKDSGTLLPGIGGSLDLIDSICFTAPALWIYLQWRTG